MTNLKTAEKLSRRAVLRLSMLVAAASTSLGARRGRDREEAVPALTDPFAVRLAGIARPAKSARKLGLAILAEARVWPKTADLIEQLGDRRKLESMGDAELRQALLESHLRDLSNELTVEVRGWILSRTEAYLYVLSAGVAP